MTVIRRKANAERADALAIKLAKLIHEDCDKKPPSPQDEVDILSALATCVCLAIVSHDHPMAANAFFIAAFDAAVHAAVEAERQGLFEDQQAFLDATDAQSMTRQ